MVMLKQKLSERGPCIFTLSGRKSSLKQALYC